MKTYFVPFLVNDENGIVPFTIKVELYEMEDLYRKTEELLLNRYELDGYNFYDNKDDVENSEELYVLICIDNSILL